MTQKRCRVILLSIILILMAIPSVFSYDTYTIIDDVVYINDTLVYMAQEPHTLYSSGWVTNTLISKQYSGNIDVFFGFNSTTTQPTQVELYSPHTVTEPMSYTCAPPYWYNYTLNPKHFYCWSATIVYDNQTKQNVTVNSLIFDHEFDTANIGLNTAYWDESHNVDYVSVASFFNNIAYDYDGKDTWYYATNVPIVAGNEYNLRIYIDTEINTAGKYDWCVKPSTETIQEAIANGHLYCLDPWWSNQPNTNRSYVRQLNITNAYTYEASAGDTVCFNFSHADLVTAGKSHHTGDDVLISWYDNVSENESFLGRGTTYIGWNNQSNTTVCFNLRDGISAGATDGNYYLYYGNTSAVSANISVGINGKCYDDFADGNVTDWVGQDGTIDGIPGYLRWTYNDATSFMHTHKTECVVDSNVGRHYLFSWNHTVQSTSGREGMYLGTDVSYGYGLVTYPSATQIAELQNNNAWGTISASYGCDVADTSQFWNWHGWYDNNLDDSRLNCWNLNGTNEGGGWKWDDQTFPWSPTTEIAGMMFGFGSSYSAYLDFFLATTDFDFRNFTVYVSGEQQQSGADTTIPNVVEHNITNTTHTTSGITVQLNASDDVGISRLWFQNSSGNSTYLTENGTISSTWDEGEHWIIAWANDTAGNVNSSTNTSFTVDTIPPNIITNLTNSSYNTDNITVQLNTTAADAHNIWINFNSTNSSLLVPNTTTNLSSLGDGQYNITIYVNDTVGNLNSTQIYFTVDTIAPHTLLIESPLNNSYVTTSTTVDFNFTATDSLSSMQANLTIDGVLNLTSQPVTNGSTTTYTQTLNQGLHNFSILVYDAAGNTNQSSVYVFTVDTDPPIVENISLSPSSIHRDQGTKVSVDVAENTTAIDSVILQVTIDGTGIAVNYTMAIEANNTYIYSYIANHTTTHRFTIYANDSAGNINNTITTSIVVGGSGGTTSNPPSGGGGGGIPSKYDIVAINYTRDNITVHTYVSPTMLLTLQLSIDGENRTIKKEFRGVQNYTVWYPLHDEGQIIASFYLYGRTLDSMTINYQINDTTTNVTTIIPPMISQITDTTIIVNTINTIAQTTTKVKTKAEELFHANDSIAGVWPKTFGRIWHYDLLDMPLSNTKYLNQISLKWIIVGIYGVLVLVFPSYLTPLGLAIIAFLSLRFLAVSLLIHFIVRSYSTGLRFGVYHTARMGSIGLGVVVLSILIIRGVEILRTAL